MNTLPLYAFCHHLVNWGRAEVTEVQAANSSVSNEVPPLDLIRMDLSLQISVCCWYRETSQV